MTEDDLQVDLFGGLVVRRGGRDLAGDLPGRKGRALVACLAVNGSEGVTREEIIDILWTGRGPVDRRANLRTLLSRIRDVLGPDALDPGERLRLVIPEEAIDLTRVRSQVAAARRHRDQGRARDAACSARAAAAPLAKGLLPGVDQPWLTRLRRSFEEDLAEMLACVAEMGSVAGGVLGDDAISAARDLARIEGYLERGHAHLMRALARRGERGEALRVYEAVNRTLRDELGTPPGSELQALRATIMRGDPVGQEYDDPGSAWRTAPHGLTPAVAAAAADPGFVGRDHELSELAGDTEMSRVVVVSGPVGIGKSSLLARAVVAARHAGRVVLAGRCDSMPLIDCQPFAEMFAQLLGSLTQEKRAELLSQAPEIERLLPSALHDRRPASVAPSATDYPLLNAAGVALRWLAARTPVTVMIDDLHRADPVTHRMLRHVERDTRDLPITFLVGQRSAPAEHAPGFVEVMGDVLREREVSTIRLGGLGADEVGRLACAEAGSAVPGAVVSLVIDRAGGHPLYSREYIRNLVAARGPSGSWPSPTELRTWPVPRGIADLVDQQVAELSAGEQELLVRAASSSGALRPTGLAAAAEAGADVAATLDRLAAAGLVTEVPGSPGGFEFAQPVVRTILARRAEPPSGSAACSPPVEGVQA